MSAVWIALAAIILLWLVMELIHHSYRLSKMSGLKCPQCGKRYALAVAWRSQQRLVHILWEPGAKPRFGESENNIREYKCGGCGSYATMNLYGERLTWLEESAREARQVELDRQDGGPC